MVCTQTNNFTVTVFILKFQSTCMSVTYSSNHKGSEGSEQHVDLWL